MTRLTGGLYDLTSTSPSVNTPFISLPLCLCPCRSAYLPVFLHLEEWLLSFKVKLRLNFYAWKSFSDTSQPSFDNKLHLPLSFGSILIISAFVYQHFLNTSRVLISKGFSDVCIRKLGLFSLREETMVHFCMLLYFRFPDNI